ncbi:citrate/2-methylcitrate synthase [Gallaecimonas kandeliae]|uniref:citrate/2-methylcitrate synthase n=1 Tax=Gallaecimonas kandeliae TaxID=3029055 RepID=UPI002649EDAE|nr:citrate/2-methylcitrate synthase [Gallaecimonas kandeliae]WKE64584.1 citrate/2-methylcitrate synthase [Gallaecimonas kandeliae]
MTTEINIGLEGVLVGATAISNVEGDIGRLSYRGQDIHALSQQSLAAVIALVLADKQLTEDEAKAFDAWLAAESELGAVELRVLEQLGRGLHPMAVLQALAPITDTQARNPLPAFLPKELEKALVLAAKQSAIVRAWHNLCQFGSLVELPAGLGFAEKLLYAFNRAQPSAHAVRALETVQILQMDHSFNAGTFAGRVVASTKASLAASIGGSLGALSGPLHGGADEAAVMMAREIGSADQAAAWVSTALANKVKIMGMGHREYRRLDPRAAILKPMARQFCEGTQYQGLMDTLVAVEEACQDEFGKKGKEIHANLEFYKGAVYLALGISEPYFTSLFACARVFGWTAHFFEFNQDPRLIRPRALYIGK